ncbi:MAG: signal peptide peptidase SppA [Saprospiraceae bacterium]|nr:signal peptide peptidase SppA [Candidatus Vicinibacter affinis]
MGQFLKFVFASCLGTILAGLLLFLILIGIGTSMASKSMDGEGSATISDPSVLKIKIPDFLPEQTNNVQFSGFSFKEQKVLGVHDIAQCIINAAVDPKIKGIYLISSNYAHGYATLKIIRDALFKFKDSGKFLMAYVNFTDHKNYFINSVADQIYMHPLGFVELKGFGASIPFYKEMMEKIGLKFNIYYAGEFKSATEPFRLSKMSPENRLQLSEYLNGQFALYTEQVAKSRNLENAHLKNIFDQFLASSPMKALEYKLIDSIAYEIDAQNNLRFKLGLDAGAKINFVNLNEYFLANGKSKQDYSAKNKIAVVFAEGNIIDGPGQEGEIGRKYVKIIRDIRENKNVKAIVLRVNSPGGSAMMSDEILREIDLARAEGKPVVVSMGDYAASGGYYIACHADSIFASPHTLTGSIGVFAMIPNVKTMTDEKLGIDFDTIGTGPMASKFNLTQNWGTEEANIIQENIDHTYKTFLKVVSLGRNMSTDQVNEIARGRIWLGSKALQNGLISKIGELDDAIKSAATLASIDRYRITEYPQQKDPVQKFIDQIKGDEDDIKSTMTKKILKENLGSVYPYYEEWLNIQKNTGVQMRLPIKILY